MWLNRSILFLVAGLTVVAGGPLAASAWDSSPQEPPSKPESTFFFMSGTVSELESDRLTITRVVAGRATEKHAFVMTAETTVEGKLRIKARVTVGYVKGEEADTAVRIIVRSSSQQGPKK